MHQHIKNDKSTRVSTVKTNSQFKLVAVSTFKSVILVSICVITNLLGVLASELTDNILLLDFSGTIAIAMIYGPIHSSIVGIVSTYIGQMFVPEFIASVSSQRFTNYFLFAPVHMVIGMVVFLVPRTMHRTMAANLFSGDHKKYPAGRLLIAIILLSFLTDLAASFSFAIIMEIDQFGNACSSDGQQQIKNTSLNICKIIRLLFFETSSVIEYEVLKIAATKLIISFPDHLVCFSSAIIVIAYILDARRYKMSHPFSKTIITNHPVVGAAYYFIFLFLIYLYTTYVYERAGLLSAFMLWTFYNIFIMTIALMIVSGRFNAWWFKPSGKEQREYTFKKINSNLKDAYEDSMKFAILYSVMIYFIVGWLESQFSNEASKLLKDKLMGALGVVVVISLLRYLVLIVSRVGRYLKKFCYDKRPTLG